MDHHPVIDIPKHHVIVVAFLNEEREILLVGTHQASHIDAVILSGVLHDLLSRQVLECITDELLIHRVTTPTRSKTAPARPAHTQPTAAVSQWSTAVWSLALFLVHLLREGLA